jgi:hypothetical protein
MLKGVAWTLFAIAGLAFWVGGRAISEFAHTERILAELEGLVIAVALGGLGFVAKTAGDRVSEPKEQDNST